MEQNLILIHQDGALLQDESFKYRTVPAGIDSIYHFVIKANTEKTMFCTGQNTSHTGPYRLIPASF